MVMILGILFWVLCALLVVCGMVWIYIQLIYMRMAKEDWIRENKGESPYEEINTDEDTEED